jgi:hypothetical protein
MIRHLANPPRASSGRTKHHLLSACMWPCRGGRPWAGLTETRSGASDLRPGPAIGRHTRAHLSHFPEGDFGWSHSAIKAASNVARNNPALVSLADTAQIADEKSRVPRSGTLHNELAGANAGGLGANLLGDPNLGRIAAAHACSAAAVALPWTIRGFARPSSPKRSALTNAERV